MPSSKVAPSPDAAATSGEPDENERMRREIAALKEELAASKAELAASKAELTASKVDVVQLTALLTLCSSAAGVLLEQSSVETGAQETARPPATANKKPVELQVEAAPAQGKPVAPAPPLPTPIVPSPAPPPGEKADSKAAPPDFSSLIKENLVLPDEDEGPYAFDRYHMNYRGANRGFFDNRNPGGARMWRDSNLEKLKKWPSLAAVDWDHTDAPDPDYLLNEFNMINGNGLFMSKLRPEIVKMQGGMKAAYGEAFEQAFAGAGPTLEKIKKLKKDGPKKERQPRGKDLNISRLFKGALGAIGELWAYGLEVREASGEHDAGLSWGIKKAVRTRCWHTLRCDTLSHAVVDTMRVDTLRGDTLLHAVVDTLRVDTLRGDTLLVTRCVLTRCVATRCYTLLVTRCVLSRYAVCMYEDGGEMNTTNDFDFKPFRRFTRCALTRCYMLHAVGHTLLVTRCLFFLQAVVDTLHAVGAFSSKLYFFTRSCGHTL